MVDKPNNNDIIVVDTKGLDINSLDKNSPDYILKVAELAVIKQILGNSSNVKYDEFSNAILYASGGKLYKYEIDEPHDYHRLYNLLKPCKLPELKYKSYTVEDWVPAPMKTDMFSKITSYVMLMV